MSQVRSVLEWMKNRGYIDDYELVETGDIIEATVATTSIFVERVIELVKKCAVMLALDRQAPSTWGGEEAIAEEYRDWVIKCFTAEMVSEYSGEIREKIMRGETDSETDTVVLAIAEIVDRALESTRLREPSVLATVSLSALLQKAYLR